MAFLGNARHQWRAVIAWSAIMVIAALVCRYLQFRANYDLCEIVDTHTLSGPAGQAIEMDTRFCSALAGDPGTIVIRFRAKSNAGATIVFAYNPTNPGPQVSDPPWYPQIAWIGPNRVVISISRISQIQRQRFEANDVHFAYRIGKIDYLSAI